MIVYIYALIDPRDNRIRYIGKTVSPSQRLTSHIYSRGTNIEKDEWINGLRSAGLFPIMKTIDRCNTWDWQFRERYWIAKYRKEYEDLLNIADGGISSGSKSQFHECNLCRCGKTDFNNICEHCDSNRNKIKLTERDRWVIKELLENCI